MLEQEGDRGGRQHALAFLLQIRAGGVIGALSALALMISQSSWPQTGGGFSNPLDNSNGYSNFNPTNTYDPYNRTPQYMRVTDMPGGDKSMFEDLEFQVPIVGRAIVDTFYDSNVLNTNVGGAKGSFGTFIQPWVVLPMQHRNIFAGLGYSLRAQVYEAVPRNNIVNNYLNAFTDMQFSHRSRLSLNGAVSFGSDPIGTLFSQGDVAAVQKTPNAWRSQSFGALYRYGADGAKGRLEFRFDYIGRTYENNPELTSGRDINQYNLGGAFYYRVLPKTAMLFEVIESFSDYKNSLAGGANQTNNQLRFLTGVSWRATARTMGILKVGYLIKEFESAAQDSVGGLTFDGAVRWSPSSADTFGLGAAMITNESNYLSGAMDSQTYSISWYHQWLPRLRSSIYANAMENNYTGSNRRDKGYMLGVGLYHPIREWLTGGLQYNYTDRSSTDGQFGFARQLVMLSFNVSF